MNGANPNGTWSLYAVDKATLDSGAITNGWILTLTVAGVVPAAADLSVAMTAESGPVVVTSNLTYTLAITNHGPSPATAVVLTNPLPAGLAFVSAAPSTGSATTNAAGQLVWDVGGLAKDGAATLSVVTRSTAVGPVILTANAAANVSDPNLDNNTVSQVVNVSAASADLAVGVVGSPSPVSLGSTVTYAIGVTNLGPAVATAVGVTNQLPAGFNVVSATPAGYVVNGSSVAFTNLGDLGSGGTLAVSIVARPATRGTFTNTVQVGSAIVVDPLKANNAASVKTDVEAPTISLTITGDNLTLAWSLSAGSYVLESADSLVTPVVWTQVVSPAPQIINGQRVVTVPIGTGNKYFRLRAPGL
jgi:uncharacterized repeat protein (TIGR01451 family)